jgi:short-subunit dehydrogenase
VLFRSLDVLINNAGVGVVGSFMGTEAKTWRWALDINVMGVVHGCQLFVPKMIEHKTQGHVVNTASAAGYSAAKLMPVYAATKFAVVGLSDALRAELRSQRIPVTTLCPGVIDTPITKRAKRTGNLADKPDFSERAAKLYRLRNFTPSRVAQAVIHAVETRHSGILPVSPEAWLLYYGSRFTPKVLSRMLERDVL